MFPLNSYPVTVTNSKTYMNSSHDSQFGTFITSIQFYKHWIMIQYYTVLMSVNLLNLIKSSINGEHHLECSGNVATTCWRFLKTQA
jgi:hypothetical protein